MPRQLGISSTSEIPKRIRDWASGGTRDPSQGYCSIQTPHFCNAPPIKAAEVCYSVTPQQDTGTRWAPSPCSSPLCTSPFLKQRFSRRKGPAAARARSCGRALQKSLLACPAGAVGCESQECPPPQWRPWRGAGRRKTWGKRHTHHRVLPTDVSELCLQR